MSRSFRVPEGGMQMRTSKEKEEELDLFLEMRKIDKERDNHFIHNSDEFDAPLGTKGSSPIYDISATLAPALKTASDEFLNSEDDKNDYEWLITPPATPLFSSLDLESQNTIMSQTGTPNAHPTALKSRLANVQLEPTVRSNLASRQSASPGLNISDGGGRRPSSSGGPGTRSATPIRRPTLNSTSKLVLTSALKSSPTATSKPSLATASKPSRSSTPTTRASLASTKPTVPARSSTPTPRSTARSSTPTTRSTARSSTPTARPSARSSTPAASSTARSSTPAASSTARSSTHAASSTARTSSALASSAARSSTPTTRSTARYSTLPARSSSSPASNPTSRATMPIRRPMTISTASDPTSPPVKSPSLFPKVAPATARYSVPQRVSSPTVKPIPWKPSEMPGFSLDAPPNLRTSLPISATRGKPGVTIIRSSSVEPAPNGRIRRQSCSPSRGRPPNGINVNSRSSVPALNRAYANANDNVSPVMYGTKMVERVINMRKLVPPRQDDKHSPHSNLSGKSSSPDSSGFGRSLSKKSLDMAMRHMDIRLKYSR